MPKITLCDLIGARFRGNSERVAVVDERVVLTYGELNGLANQLAHYLMRQGIGAEDVVAVALPKSVELIVSLLAVIKAGAAYLPLEPEYPRQRLDYMLEDAKPKCVVTSTTVASRLPSGVTTVALDSAGIALAVREYSTADPDDSVRVRKQDPRNPVYVMYTSGSTGSPKGVVMHTEGLMNLLVWHLKEVSDNRDEKVAQFASVCFDLSAHEIFSTLIAGKTLALPSDELRRDMALFVDWLDGLQVTELFGPDAMLQVMSDAALEKGKTLSSLHRIYQAGEAVRLSPRFVEFLGSAPSRRLYNLYGPTECQAVTLYSLPEDTVGLGSTVPIGRAVWNTRLYVLDASLKPVTIGAAGELYISGAQMARGYLNKPALTAERFVANPFEAGGMRMYRTGDLCRWRTDGNLEYLGRTDEQVKIRGFRIELGEIEAALCAHAAVAQTAVVLREDRPGKRQLVAYVVVGMTDVPDVSRSESRRVLSDLRAWLLTKLPDYMVPAAFVRLEQLPITQNGKLDRKALPAPESESLLEYLAPVTVTEELIAALFGQVMSMERVGAGDNFFELGGHSLLATQLMSRIRETFGVELPLRTIFEAPEVRQLATRVEALKREGRGSELPPLEVQTRPKELPLSFAQERLWIIEQFEPLGGTYNMPVALRLEGELNVEAVRLALNEIVRRHESLRTRFESYEERPVQIIEQGLEIELLVEDLSALRETEQKEKIEEALKASASASFDLKKAPLFRAELLRLGPKDHIALLTMHHIISDGWSMGVLVEEFSSLYASYVNRQESKLAELPLQYADFTLWQRSWLKDNILKRQLDYWTQQLAGAPLALEVATDKPRPAMQTFRGGRESVVFSPQLSAGVNGLARSEAVTPFMVLLAAYQIVLSRWSNQDDVVVGSPIANRTQAATEKLIGFFVNTLVLRTRVSLQQSFRELLGQVRKVTLGGYAHQDLPFERLVEALQPERDLSRQPIFQAMFVLQNAPMDELRLPGLQLMPLISETYTAKFDLNLSLNETESGYEGHLEYASDLFEPDTIRRLVTHLERVLRAVVADPEEKIGQIGSPSAEERERVLVEWNGIAQEVRETTLPALFEVQVERSADKVAVVCEHSCLTYRELNERANKVAHYLVNQGIGPEDIVAIALPRSVEMLICMLGTLKAGAAYLPLDPDHPEDRLVLVLGDSRPKCVLTNTEVGGRLGDTPGQVRLDERESLVKLESSSTVNPRDFERVRSLRSKHAAYIIYTSGSRGKPKGVVVSHDSVVNQLFWMGAEYPVCGDDKVLARTSVCFDASIWELYLPLLSGASTHVACDKITKHVDRIVEYIEEQRLTIAQFVPSMLAGADLKLLKALKGLRGLFLGGEQLSGTLASKLISVCRSGPINLYGPTETTVQVTSYACRSDLKATSYSVIGRPVWNTQLYVLDSFLQLAPIGVPGELYVGGVQVTRGYLNRPGLTAERFIANPFGGTGGRLYRTGDLARWRADGVLEFLGRMDDQVKIRGFRVELGEIEAVVSEHPAIAGAAVVAREDKRDQKRLVGYVVFRNGENVDGSGLRRYLNEKLPDYMVPTAFVAMDRLPLSPNGKLDRKALPVPEPVVQREYLCPRNPTELRLVEIWAAVLGIEKVGVNDNFFELGGHSLLATQVISRVRIVFGIDVPLRAVFEAPTIMGLAAEVEKLRTGDQTSEYDEDSLFIGR